MARTKTAARKTKASRKRKTVSPTEPEVEEKKEVSAEYNQITITQGDMDALLSDMAEATYSGKHEQLAELSREQQLVITKEMIRESGSIEACGVVCAEDGDDMEDDTPTVKKEEEEEGEEKQYRKRRCRVFKPMIAEAMKEVFDADGSYILGARDPFNRKIRHAIKTARLMPNVDNPYIHDGYFHILHDAEIHRVPINGRSAKRFEGAAMARGLEATQALDRVGIDKVTLSFMNDLGFGSTAARKIRQEWDTMVAAAKNMMDTHEADGGEDGAGNDQCCSLVGDGVHCPHMNEA